MKVEKKCLVCGNEFFDCSLNQTKKTCSKKCRTKLLYKDPKKYFDRKFQLRIGVLNRQEVILDDSIIEKIKQDLIVGRCAICGKKIPDFYKRHIDHDHITKQYRGVLCAACNIAVGLLEDNPVIAEKMISYLELSDKRNSHGGVYDAS